MFKILCEVSGGVTGYRRSFLKNGKTGDIQYYDLFEDADEEAHRLNTERNGNPFRKASFSYTVVEA
jgi:hypothetical protein